MSVRLVSVVLAGIFAAVVGVGAANAASQGETSKSRPAAVKRGDANAAECAWLGKRIIQLLSRDDVVTAGEFRQFYESFGCSNAHLGAAFGCAIEGADGSESCASRSQCVDLCWTSPSASTLDKAPPPKTESAKPAADAAKSGKVPPAPPKKPAETKPADAKPAEAKPSVLPRSPYDKAQ